MSFKKMNMGSKICFEGQVSKVQYNQFPEDDSGRRCSRTNAKKISIFIMQEDSSSSQYSDSLISTQSVRTLRSIEIPAMDMNLQTIRLIFQAPQPFLITLALSLFIRYCFASKNQVRLQDSAWVLCISAILSYKIYYDEELQGLIECFMGIMGAVKQDLIDLERCFLEAIKYQTIVRNYEYHFVLSKLIATEVKNK